MGYNMTMTELLKTNLPEFALFEQKTAGGNLITAVVKRTSVNSVMTDSGNTILGLVESSLDRDVDGEPALVVNFIRKYDLAGHLFTDGFGTFLGYQAILGQVNFLRQHNILPIQVGLQVTPDHSWSRLTNLLDMRQNLSVFDGDQVVNMPARIFR